MTMTTCPGTSAPAEAEAISLYEAIGGRPAVVAAVDVFYRRLLADPELAPFFPGGVGARHRRYLATFLGEALGGPKRYGGPDIATAHRGRGISNAHFDRAAAHLGATLGEPAIWGSGWSAGSSLKLTAPHRPPGRSGLRPPAPLVPHSTDHAVDEQYRVVSGLAHRVSARVAAAPHSHAVNTVRGIASGPRPLSSAA